VRGDAQVTAGSADEGESDDRLGRDRIGRQLDGRWHPMRFILGPSRWMPVIYHYDEANDLAIVLTIQDARSSTAAAN
jgi:hypothetical protein